MSANYNIQMDNGDEITAKDLKAIIFDFDGTLVDSEPAWKSTFHELFADRYNVELSDEILWENTGNGVEFSVANISNAYQLNMDESEINKMTIDLHQEMHRLILEELPLRNGAIELFQWANEASVDMAICTASTDEMIDGYLSRLGIRNFFKEVTSTAISDVDKRKPHPYPYLETMKKLGVKASETLAIEDSPSGVTSSVAAGIKTIAIHNPFIEEKVLQARPTLQVKDFLQVLELLAS